jgi:hypothetical protein
MLEKHGIVKVKSNEFQEEVMFIYNVISLKYKGV